MMPNEQANPIARQSRRSVGEPLRDSHSERQLTPVVMLSTFVDALGISVAAQLSDVKSRQKNIPFGDNDVGYAHGLLPCFVNVPRYRAGTVDFRGDRMLKSHHDVWYVRASFGIEWGPISASTLLEMAESGALARDDVARGDTQDHWQPIQAVVDELREQLSVLDHQQSDAELTAEESDFVAADGQEVGSDDSVDRDAHPTSSPFNIRKPRLGALPGWSNHWTPHSAGTLNGSSARYQFPSEEAEQFQSEQFLAEPSESFDAPVENDDGDRHDVHDVEPDHDEPDHDFESTASDQSPTLVPDQFTQLESWKRERAERLERLLKIVADREAAAKKVIVETVESDQRAIPELESTAILPSDESAFDADLKPSSVPKIRPLSVKAESWSQFLERWKRSLPSREAVAVSLLIACAAWWFWPESYGNVAETYRAMYSKLEDLRELENNKTGMEEFVEESQAKLAKIVPVLELRSTPNRPESQWLLWMGRDGLAPMLKNPRLRDTKAEVTFKKLLAEWDRKFHPTALAPKPSSDLE
jgi:hypothetical protein